MQADNWLESGEARAFVKQFVYQIAKTEAPRELSEIDDIVDDYYETPEEIRAETNRSGSPLQSGGLPVIEMSFIVTIIVTTTLEYLTRQFLAEGIQMNKTLFERLFFGKRTEQDHFLQLTKEQKEEIRQVAIRKALDATLDREQAKRIADNIVREL